MQVDGGPPEGRWTSAAPTTQPDSLMSAALLLRLPRVPRSSIRPRCHRKAWRAPLRVVLQPTTCPRSLRALAQVDDPPSVLKRVTFGSWRTNAWQGKSTPLRLLFTTTCPSSLIPTGQLTRSPGKTPRSCILQRVKPPSDASAPRLHTAAAR